MTQWIQTDGGRIAYEVLGSGGPPVVAIPGIGDTRASYRKLGPALADAGYTVYLTDLRGHGESDVGFASHRSEDIGDDVLRLVEGLDLRDVTLLGNSVGAAASVHASLGSDRIGRIVLLSGFVSDPPKFGLLRFMLLLMFAWPWGVWAWGKYRRTLFKTAPADMGANHTAVLENLRQPGRLRALRAMMRASKASIAARLGDVSVPALIAMGAQDPDFPNPKGEARRQETLLGGQNQVVMVEQAGHYPQIERPEETTRAILEFIRNDGGDGA